MPTTEQKAGKAILQEPTVVKVAGTGYRVSHPSLATLIKVSAVISTMPRLEIDKEQVMAQTFAFAPECAPQIARVVATLILGAKRPTERTIAERIPLIGKRLGHGGRLRRLTETLLYDTTPRELSNLIIRLMSLMQIEDFFGITISLNEVNMLRPTREMGTTARGQSSQERQRDSD